MKYLIYAVFAWAVLSPSQSKAQWYNTIDNQQQNAVTAENYRRNMMHNQQIYQMQEQHNDYVRQQQIYQHQLNSNSNSSNYYQQQQQQGCIGYFSCK